MICYIIFITVSLIFFFYLCRGIILLIMPINYQFLEQNKDQLIQIYVKERYTVNKNEEGVLLIDYRKEDKIDVMYIPVSKMIPQIKSNFETAWNDNLKNNVDNKKSVFLMLLSNDEMVVKTYQV